MPLLQEDGLDGQVEAAALGGQGRQGERVRRSLVTLDNALPSIALPDGVHCRSFTGARHAEKPAQPCTKQPCCGCCHLWKRQHCAEWVFSSSACRRGQLSAGLGRLIWQSALGMLANHKPGN